jgi:hypothetical protein
MKPVPADSLDAALEHVRKGGRLVIPTYTRCTVIDRRCLERFEKAGAWLLKAEGQGYRMRCGKGSVYLLPGQLQFA